LDYVKPAHKLPEHGQTGVGGVCCLDPLTLPFSSSIRA
jgi:hypothetical protein